MSAVEVKSPPTTTVASGRCVSAPTPVEINMGIRPRLATEAVIQSALDRLMLGRTSFVIAQRISTVMHADQILVLDKGQVVARGTHAELLEDSPIYAEIYNSQLVGSSAGQLVGSSSD